FRPTNNGTFDLSVTYLDAKFVDFVLNSVPPLDYSGLDMPRAPKWTLSGGYTHTFDLANGSTVVAGAHSYFQTGTYLMFQQFSGSYQKSFSRTDVDVTYNAPRDAWYAGVYMRNLENTLYATDAAAGPGNVPALALAPPRMYGVRFGARF